VVHETNSIIPATQRIYFRISTETTQLQHGRFIPKHLTFDHNEYDRSIIYGHQKTLTEKPRKKKKKKTTTKENDHYMDLSSTLSSNQTNLAER
jgi:hypothetical protein